MSTALSRVFDFLKTASVRGHSQGSKLLEGTNSTEQGIFCHRHRVQDNIGHWKFLQLAGLSNVQPLTDRSQPSLWSIPAGGLVLFAFPLSHHNNKIPGAAANNLGDVSRYTPCQSLATNSK